MQKRLIKNVDITCAVLKITKYTVHLGNISNITSFTLILKGSDNGKW